MPLTALGLVLLAAVLHASWNIAAKHAGGDQRFTLLTSVMTSLLWLPAGLWFGWDEVPRWGLVEWGAVAAGRQARVGGVDVRVLHPPAPDWERRRPRNDDSIVLEASFGAVSVILPGDIGPAIEAALGGVLAPASLRVLKAAHHGSRASSTAPFLDAVAPAILVASAGRANRHGHPDPAVLARARERGAAIYRTDRDGAIAVDTDGRWVRVTTCAGTTPVLDAHAPPRPPPALPRLAGRDQARWMPGLPSSTTSEARVSIDAPGRDTNGTMR